jgi:hypothetical protein
VYRLIQSSPEELDRAGLSDERRAEVGHEPVRLHQLLPERVRRIGIVFSVLVVLGERDSGFYLVGLPTMCDSKPRLSSAESVSL